MSTYPLLFRLNGEVGYGDSGGCEIALGKRALRILEPGELQSAVLVTNSSTIVNLVAQLDSFITQTTSFLLLCFPKSLSNGQIAASEVLQLKSPSELITDLALKKTREVGYKSLNDRLDHLHDQFGLSLTGHDELRNELEAIIEIRNRAVHDHARGEIYLSDGLRLVRRECSSSKTSY